MAEVHPGVIDKQNRVEGGEIDKKNPAVELLKRLRSDPSKRQD